MSENKTIESLIDSTESEATTAVEGAVSHDAEIGSDDTDNANATDHESEGGADVTSTTSEECTDATSTESQTVYDADAFSRTEANTCVPMQLADAASEATKRDDLESDKGAETSEMRTRFARVPIKVYVNPNEKSRFYETTGTYHIIGDNIVNCFQPVICSVPGIGRVEGYIKVNGGK